MRRPSTRRSVLRTLPLFALGSGLASVSAYTPPGTVRGSEPARPDEPFDPGTHGFGFRNWSTRVPTYPEHDHDAVTESQVRQAIRTDWDTPLRETIGLEVSRLSTALVDAVSTQIYVSANQFSATNGHCYGMVYTAQSYYEDPDSIPLDRDAAGEIVHPSEPLAHPGHNPVGETIDLLQISQILDPHSWFGRRGMLRPQWIDVADQVSNIVATVEEFGTAAITVIDLDGVGAHQVLVYDSEQSGNRTDLFIYDPNYASGSYARGRESVLSIHGDSMASYGQYDTLLFNRRDRLARADVDVSGMPAFDRDPDRIRDLFCLVLFLVRSPDVELAVVDPDGVPVERDTATFADRTRTAYDAMRYRYDAPSGEYGVAVTAIEDTEYTLSVEGAEIDGPLIEETITESLSAGETHEYTVDLPDSSDERGSIVRDTDPSRWPYAVGGAAAGGAAVAGYAYLQRLQYRNGGVGGNRRDGSGGETE